VKAVKPVSRASAVEKLFKLTHINLALNNSVPTMPHLRGNLEATTLLVGPPSTPEEYSAQVPFSDRYAQVFHTFLAEAMGLDSQRDFLSMTCVAFGAKANKLSILPARAFVQQSVDRGLFKKYIAVGSIAYHSIFGNQRVTGPFNAGTILYPPVLRRGTENAPLFVFPSLELLQHDFENDGQRLSREHWLLRNKQQDLIKNLFALVERFKGFMAL
jgi:uracil-DNA glycosylase